ncbi:hypothetical protein [Deinococcus sonorensis]|uniref:Uncharacterized protein n=1 Tax=Deinococcus sonorensis TaxID=309891 RepID=A0ABV8YE15_9DEIO
MASNLRCEYTLSFNPAHLAQLPNDTSRAPGQAIHPASPPKPTRSAH